MVQYLHFRILEFPLIFSSYTTHFASLGTDCAWELRWRVLLRRIAKNAGCLVEVFPAEISHWNHVGFTQCLGFLPRFWWFIDSFRVILEMSCSWVYDYDIGSPLQAIFANPTHQLNQSQSSDMLGSSFTTSNCWCMASTQKARRAEKSSWYPNGCWFGNRDNRKGSQNWIVEEFEALKSLVCPLFFVGRGVEFSTPNYLKSHGYWLTFAGDGSHFDSNITVAHGCSFPAGYTWLNYVKNC